MKILRSPVAQFLIAGLILITAISLGASYLSDRAADDEALDEAKRINAVLATSVAAPGVRKSLIREEDGAVDEFDNQVLDLLLVEDVKRVNIWDKDGRLVYSSVFLLIGEEFALGDDRHQVLAEGGTGSELSDPMAEETRLPPEARASSTAADDGDLVRIYTRFQEGKRDLLFEGYYALGDIEDRREEIYSSFRWITIGGPLLLVLLVTPILYMLTRRLTSGAKERERLLHSSLDASDAERRRIARDLHDSVVQDLAGTAFSISAVARDPETAETSRRRLDDAGSALRDGLKALRSLLAEIHPPDLQAEGLSAALADLIAPAATAGVQASVSVEGAETASDERAALVWRVAQEAVRNSLRHAHASTLAVTVRVDGPRLVLEVVDDGIGFDPKLKQRDDSFGLRGLRSLVSEAGGTLVVQSSPGEGTAVLMEVAAR